MSQRSEVGAEAATPGCFCSRPVAPCTLGRSTRKQTARAELKYTASITDSSTQACVTRLSTGFDLHRLRRMSAAVGACHVQICREYYDRENLVHGTREEALQHTSLPRLCESPGDGLLCQLHLLPLPGGDCQARTASYSTTGRETPARPRLGTGS